MRQGQNCHVAGAGQNAHFIFLLGKLKGRDGAAT